MKAIKINPSTNHELFVIIEGVSPLLIHRFGLKAKREILARQKKKARLGKEKRNHWEEFWDAMYYRPHPDGSISYGFPVLAFMKAMTRQSKHLEGFSMTDFRSAVTVASHDEHPLAWVWGDLHMHVTQVRVKQSADIRFRPCLMNWGALICIYYDGNLLSQEQIIGLLLRAGKQTGVGDWRPEKEGMYGKFQIKNQTVYLSLEEAIEQAQKIASRHKVYTREHQHLIPTVSPDLTPEEIEELLGILEAA